MISTTQAAEQIGLTQGRIRQLLREERIPGALKVGRDWLIPDAFTVAPPARPRGRARKEGKSRCTES